MASRFLLQIIDKKTGDIVQFPPGKDLEIELVEDCAKQIMSRRYVSLKTVDTAFVNACTDAIIARGVGFFRHEAHVAQDIRDGLNDAIVAGGLETTVKQLEDRFSQDIEAGIVEAITNLKRKVKA